ncbi:hypothetical protein QYM36_012857 [Artemia franciscana]|uniref:Endonuclease/exonuclease/phosphatase domain-containing protein n=1 Tax=Artemia franciscana TaxID=6661 RepID=A0AA88L3P9_ARTSF|nr:hypothetical protein QYM36_012857 [Artemia franciscana]
MGKPTTVIKQAKSRINVGCWNVRSAKQEATQAFLVHEMEKYNIDILCISETRISGSGSIVITAPETLHQFHFFYSGIEDNSGLHGVGFIMNQRTRNALLEWEPVSCRLARIRLKGNPANVSIISTYAPTRDATETTKDDFYGELQQLSSSIAARDYLIVAGDFNARVGPSDQTTRQILGKFGQGHRCENGQRLVNYALMNHLVITNTIFQHKPSHLLTWHSNDGVTKAQIDFILVRQRWRSSVQDSRSYNGADTGSQSGSDHRLVAAKILLRLAIRRKNKSKVGFDIGCTDNIFAFRLIIQQFEKYNLPLILIFLDFIAAFDSVTRQKLWKILEKDGMPLNFVELMKAYYDASMTKRSELFSKLRKWRRNLSKKTLRDGEISRRGKSESECQLLSTNIKDYAIKTQWDPANPANVNSTPSNEEAEIWEAPSHQLDIVDSSKDDLNPTAINVPSTSVHKPESVEKLESVFKKNKRESILNPVPSDVSSYSKDDITDGRKSNPVLFQKETGEEIKSTSEEITKWESPYQNTKVKVHNVVEHMVSMAEENNRLMIKIQNTYMALQ